MFTGDPIRLRKGNTERRRKREIAGCTKRHGE